MDDIVIPGLQRWTKPNVRKVFKPDPNYILFEIDLKQSDAQVVAWDSEEKAQLLDGSIVNGRKFVYKPDNSLKEIFRTGRDLHGENAKLIYNLPEAPKEGHHRQMAKHGVHATDFLATPRTMAKKLDMTVHQATAFQTRWFYLHPNIPVWHYWIEMELMRTRTITNAFGYRHIYFDRIQNILPEAVAFIPQSTTCNVIDKIINRICGDPLRGIPGEVPEVMPLLQVHDSFVGQFHVDHWPSIVPRIHTCTKIEVPYRDRLCIGTDFSASHVSWGAVKKFPWADFTGPAAPTLPLAA